MPRLPRSRDCRPAIRVYVAEIDLDAAEAIAAKTEIQVEPLPRYPSSHATSRFSSTTTLPAATVESHRSDAAPDTLVRVREFDRYQGKGVPEGKVSPVAAPHLPLTGAHAHRCRGAVGDGPGARRASREARAVQRYVNADTAATGVPLSSAACGQVGPAEGVRRG
jgi:hypothetical protein